MAEREGTTAPLNPPVSLLRIAMKMYGFQKYAPRKQPF